MNMVQTVLAVLSVISFGITVVTLVQKTIAKTREQANIELVKQELTALVQALNLVGHCVDAIVQIPKHRPSTVEELQDLARIARGQLHLLRKDFARSQERIHEWRFGKLLSSSEIGDLAREALNEGEPKADQAVTVPPRADSPVA
jgi:hypothetical protein